MCVFLRLYFKESLKKLTVRHPLNKYQDQVLKKTYGKDLKIGLKSLLFEKFWAMLFSLSSAFF